MLRAGDENAAAAIWSRYCERLSLVAKKLVGNANHRLIDEEDLVLDTLATVFRRVADGQFDDVGDRKSLWFLLLRVVQRKAIANYRYEQSAKRQPTRTLKGDTAVSANDLTCVDLPPDLVVEFRESIGAMFAKLDDDEMRKIAALKLEGYFNQEVAEMTGWSVATVERRLRLIRRRWADETN